MALKPIPAGEVPPFHKFIIYGPPGEGKTSWVAENCPDPIWFDFERSSDVLKAIGKLDIPVIPITPKDSPQDLENFILKDLNGIQKGKYKTIVFDTISSAQIFQLGHWMENNSKNDLPLYQDYRKSTTIFNRIFFALQHMDYHVALIAHEKDYYEGEGENKKLVQIGPGVTPALFESVRQLTSGVYRLQKKVSGIGKDAKPSWSMLVNNKGKYVAKNRYGLIDVEIENPTWDTFMKGNENAESVI